ncbi:DsbE family thiol:disulfide interchange protein [Rhizobium sp. CECT 9324]|uniref:DsbE family thiol:disulfide interchange protein n=1 Tax=Rhizobium sp. CECT 9324 TaxID=2845820 RepID=UPI001E5354E7|nr:DsbE family thiol:disulfide interchange protein [Rhizobium sp. CECT 9324]CAH0338696.1 Thiol:disulfide interchange protein CycY [Rhizobium sp. CECT 9324]
MNTQPSEPVRTRKGFGRYVFALLPLAFFAVIAGTAAKMLYEQDVNGRDISVIPSALIGTKAPDLALPALEGSKRPALTTAVMAGKLTLVNVFASWCVPCREEHPMLLELSRDPRINLVGINYKDRTDNALRFLGELGNPFQAIGIDPNGKAAIDWGVYGIPESYLVGPDGTILYKKVGPFDPQSIETQLMPAIEKALAAGS